MEQNQKYGYYKTKQGDEVIQFNTIEVKQPFFSFISDFLKSSDVNEDVDPFLLLLQDVETQSFAKIEEELKKITSSKASLIQRMYAVYFLNKLTIDKESVINELQSFKKLFTELKGALIDLINYTLDDSNVKLSTLGNEERLSECLKHSKHREFILNHLGKGVTYSYMTVKNNLFEKIVADDPTTFVISIVQYYMMKGIRVKHCRNCNRFFIPNRLSQDYCEYVAPGYTDKTCRDIGAVKSFAEKKSDDEAYKLYSKYYKRIYRYVSTGKLSKDDFQNWNNSAILGRNSVQDGKLSLKKYTEELNKLFTEILTHTK